IGEAMHHVARQGVHRLGAVEHDLHHAVFDGFQQVRHRLPPGLRIAGVAANVSQTAQSRNDIPPRWAERSGRSENPMKYETLLTDLLDGVMTVTLNRPDKLNAFNTGWTRELIDSFGRVKAMDEVRAIVVTGSGRAFCAGADISGGSGTFQVWNDGTAPQKREASDSITLAIFNCLKPIVAAINGAAVGVGITMCLPMDIRMISTAARIGFVFNKRGMAMEAGSCWFLPRLVGMQQAQEWVMTAEVSGAGGGRKAAVVRSVHAPADLLPAAQALARKFAASTSSSVAAAVNLRLM